MSAMIDMGTDTGDASPEMEFPDDASVAEGIDEPEGEGVEDEVVLLVHRRFGKAGRARSVEPHRHVVLVDVGRLAGRA